MVLHLKRFTPNYDTNTYDKCHHDISLSHSLDLMPYMDNLNQTSHTGSIHRYTFSLRAIVAHEGATIHSGHYVCYSCNEQRQWSLYDDTVVREIPGDITLQRLEKTAYLLFYTRT